MAQKTSGWLPGLTQISNSICWVGGREEKLSIVGTELLYFTATGAGAEFATMMSGYS
jgi:hypothetical protein